MHTETTSYFVESYLSYNNMKIPVIGGGRNVISAPLRPLNSTTDVSTETDGQAEGRGPHELDVISHRYSATAGLLSLLKQ